MEQPTWRIGMWGPTASGKTTYLASIYLHRRQAEWEIRPLDTEDVDTMNFLYGDEGAVKRLSLGEFPGGTAPGTLLEYGLRFTVPRQRSIALLWTKEEPTSYDVHMIDVSGEEIGPNRQVREDYFDRLKECDGLVLLVDPAEEHQWAAFEGYYTPVAQVVNQVDHAGLYYAICITKVDLDKYSDLPHENQEGLRDYLKGVIGRQAYDEIVHIFDQGRARMFAISSVGRYEVEGVWRPNMVSEYGTDVQTRLVHLDDRWEPINIFAPLAWIFQRTTADD